MTTEASPFRLYEADEELRQIYVDLSGTEARCAETALKKLKAMPVV